METIAKQTKYIATCKACGKVFDLAPISRQNLRAHKLAEDRARRKLAQDLLGYSTKRSAGSFSDEEVVPNFVYDEVSI